MRGRFFAWVASVGGGQGLRLGEKQAHPGQGKQAAYAFPGPPVQLVVIP